MNIRDIANDEERRQTSTKVGKEVKKLVAAAIVFVAIVGIDVRFLGKLLLEELEL
jgi:hypothetical protein